MRGIFSRRALLVAVTMVVASVAGGVRGQSPAGTVLFFGDSLTAGYGVGRELAFPELVQQRIDARGWSFRVVNAGVSGETTSGGLRRIDWVLQQPVDVLVLELGANDALRGTDLAVTEENLAAMIDKARATRPDIRIVLAGMQVPTNLGPDYTRAFRELFPRLAEVHETELIPFLLEGVGGVPELNLADGIHPNPEGHAIVAQTVWDALEPILVDLASGS